MKDKSKIPLHQVQEEFGVLYRKLLNFQSTCYNSDVLMQEVEEVRSETKEGNRFNSPFYPMNDNVEKILSGFQPIFERFAGQAAIREAKEGKIAWPKRKPLKRKPKERL